MNVATKPLTLGVIVGNRGFFPAHLCSSGRATILKVLEQEGIRAVALTPDESTYGSIESLNEAQKCADLFRQHRNEIDGVLVTLPNFGDERAIANALRWAELGVPVLIHAFPDEVGKMTIKDRRDSFCGKMSACNNLRQYGIKYSLTRLHTVDPESESFREDLRSFGAVCRVVRGLKFARIGAIGARPQAFNTVRFSEKLLERSGITVETLDLSEVFGQVERLDNSAAIVVAKLAQIDGYIPTKGIPAESLLKMAKLGAVVDNWMQERNLSASAIQCWTSMEEYFGVVPCTVMSMMSNGLMPSACETDIAGTVAMMALALASGKPSRHRGLEQQLRRGSRQGRHLPLLEPAQGYLRRQGQRPDLARRHPRHGLPGDHRRHRGQRQHLRHGRGPRQGRSLHLPAASPPTT